MDKKETIGMALLATAIVATILTATTSSSAFALGHWNDDEDDSLAQVGMASPDLESLSIDEENNGEVSNTEPTDAEDSAYMDFKACLSDNEGEESPTEPVVQECLESSYSELTTDEDDEDENDATVGEDEDEEDEDEEDEDEEDEESEEQSD